MSKKMGSVIAVYGVVLAALSFFIRQVVPAFANVVFVCGLAGGGLCVLWGIVAIAGHKRRAWAVLTLIAVAFVVLSQAVQVWFVSDDETSTRLAGRLVLTLMLLMTMGVLMYVLHGERPPEFYTTGTARPDSSPSRRNETHSDGGRHQSKFK